MSYTSDNEYLKEMMDSWEVLKNETRKKLPKIYETASDEIKVIISMLVDSEYLAAIKLDNEIRRNCNKRGEKATTDTHADDYKKENAEIIKMIEAQ